MALTECAKVTNQNPGILRFLCHLWLFFLSVNIRAHPWLKCRMDGLRNWGERKLAVLTNQEMNRVSEMLRHLGAEMGGGTEDSG